MTPLALCISMWILMFLFLLTLGESNIPLNIPQHASGQKDEPDHQEERELPGQFHKATFSFPILRLVLPSPFRKTNRCSKTSYYQFHGIGNVLGGISRDCWRSRKADASGRRSVVRVPKTKQTRILLGYFSEDMLKTANIVHIFPWVYDVAVGLFAHLAAMLLWSVMMLGLGTFVANAAAVQRRAGKTVDEGQAEGLDPRTITSQVKTREDVNQCSHSMYGRREKKRLSTEQTFEKQIKDKRPTVRPNRAFAVPYQQNPRGKMTPKPRPSCCGRKSFKTGSWRRNGIFCLSIVLALQIHPCQSFAFKQTKLATNVVPGDFLGTSVSIHGDTALVGAMGDMNFTGAAYVYKNIGSSWIEQQKLVPFLGVSGDNFGSEHAVVIHGNFAVIGSQKDDTNGKNSGSAFVYRCNGSSFVMKQKLLASDGRAHDNFADSVAMTADTLIIGADKVDNNGTNKGAAYLYRRNGSDFWTEFQKFVASDGVPNDQFGKVVSIWNNTVVVGSPGNGARPGAAYVFEFNGSHLVEKAKLMASDGVAGNWFGHSVSVHGDMIMVGAYGANANGTDSGAVYVYKRNGGSWGEEQKLLASDAEVNVKFGYSVSISGNTALIGAPGGMSSGQRTGSVYVFTRSAVWVEYQKLVASDGIAGDVFGDSVSIDGDTAVTGAWESGPNNERSGSAYIFSNLTVTTVSPSNAPTSPTRTPTDSPTANPASGSPTRSPMTSTPSTPPTNSPSQAPTRTRSPTETPTYIPSTVPTHNPTTSPTLASMSVVSLTGVLPNIPNWTVQGNVCKWTGVKCNEANTTIKSIRIDSTNSSGFIDLSTLPSNLEELDVSDNPDLSGNLNVSSFPPSLRFFNGLGTNISGVLKVDDVSANLTIIVSIYIVCDQSFCVGTSGGTSSTRTIVKCTGKDGCSATCTCVYGNEARSESNLAAAAMTEILFFLTVGIASVFGLAGVFGFGYAKKTKQDTYQFKYVIATALSVIDFLSDISFCVAMIFAKDFIPSAIGIAAVALSFAANVRRLSSTVSEWQADPFLLSIISAWLKNYSCYLVGFVVATGSFYTSMGMVHSNLFGQPMFSMGLPRKYMRAVAMYRLVDTILFENIPLIGLQLWHFSRYGLANAVVLLAFASSLATMFVVSITSYLLYTSRSFEGLKEQIFQVDLEMLDFHTESKKLHLQIRKLRIIFAGLLGIDKTHLDVMVQLEPVQERVRLVLIVSIMQDVDNLEDKLKKVCQDDDQIAKCFLDYLHLDEVKISHVNVTSGFESEDAYGKGEETGGATNEPQMELVLTTPQ